jgi:murein DD-endopeptidase MepM/ murein hydrolase activator NlpD
MHQEVFVLKQKLLIILTAILFFASFGSSSVSYAEKQKPQEKLKQIQKEKKSKKQEIQKVQEQLNKAKSDVSKLEAQIAKSDEKLDYYSKQLANNQALLKKEEAQMNQFLRRMYLKGENHYMAKILESESFSEFLIRFQLLSTLADKETNTILNYRRAKQNIENATKKIAEEQKKQAPLLAAAQKKMGVIKNTYDKYNSELAKLSKEEEATKEAIEELEQAAKKASGEFNNNLGSGILGFPSTQGLVFWNFGQNRGSHIHAGIDIPRSIGTPIYAADSGIVSLTKSNPGGYGYYVIINHGNGLSTVYAHMYRSTVLVSVGQRVKKGQKIAEVGNNGRSSGPHLHFEVRKNGSPVNPKQYLR